MEENLLVAFGALLAFQFLMLIIFEGWTRYWSGKQVGIVKDWTFEPTVAIVVPCYNEEAKIESKLANVFDMCSYNKRLMKVYVVDDYSTDDTFQIAHKFKDRRSLKNLNIWRNPAKKGKPSALNWAFDRINEDVISITDADVLWESDTLEELVRNLGNPSVGGASGKIIIGNSQDSAATRIERLYRKKYDQWRKAESNYDSCSVFNGPLMIFKREVLEKVRINERTYADDTDLLFKTRKLGYRAIYDPKAIVREFPPRTIRELFKQKIRRSRGLTQVLLGNFKVLGRYGRFGQIVYPLSIYNHIISPLITLGLLVLLPIVIMKYPFVMTAALLLCVPSIRLVVIGYLLSQFALVFGLVMPRHGRWKTHRAREVEGNIHIDAQDN